MKTKTLYAIAFIAIVVFTGCADVEHVKECVDTSPYGFWGGLWHGMICFFSFFGSLFSDDIAIYAVNNNGAWYDFGFVLGSGIIFGSASKATNKR